MSTQTAEAMPVSAERLAQLDVLTQGLDARGLTWLSGYLAGLAARGAAPVARAADVPQATIVFGTQTGTSKLIAERLHRQLSLAGVAARVVSAGKYPVRELAKESLLYVVISTQGEGDPPDEARGFYEHLLSKRAPKLSGLRFSVLALGDTSYAKYCETGRVLDRRLEELGATRLLDRAECDVDFEPIALGWVDGAFQRAKDALGSGVKVVTPLHPVQAPVARAESHPAEILVNQRITGRGALKDVRHLELSLEGSGLSYQPGDSLSVRAFNPPELVETVLRTLKLDPGQTVEREGRSLPLGTWLREELELTRLSRPVVARAAELGGKEELSRLLTPEGGEGLRALLASHQVVDLLQAHPQGWTAEDLVRGLRRLTRRQYSLASSQRRVGEEAHLTVAVVEYQAFGSPHYGAASRFLATRAVGEKVTVSVDTNERFRLPEDASRDVILIGPGTGVAPFRGFLQERAELGAQGRSWLFFGEQHFRTQFLYQTEWQEALRDRSLSRLSLAFSRDQEAKVYVQHRLREEGRDLFHWLEAGAHLYVCGDAKRMAADVHAALVDVISIHGGRSTEDAEAYLSTLREQQRYQRDIY